MTLQLFQRPHLNDTVCNSAGGACNAHQYSVFLQFFVVRLGPQLHILNAVPPVVLGRI